MELALIIGISALLQFAAVFCAFKLIRVTGSRPAWILIAMALCIMAVRRFITLWHLLSGDLAIPPDLTDESVALATSALMLAGVLGISPLFLTIKQSSEALYQSKENLRIEVSKRTEELKKANELLAQELRERQRVEEALEAERQRLFTLLDELPAYVSLKAPDYSVRFANRLCREAFGHPQGKRCYEMMGREGPCGECQQFRVLETGEPQNFEWAWTGTGRTLKMLHYPFADVDGSPLVLSLGIDITERKRAEEALQQSEEKYRLLVKQIPAVIFKGYADWSIDFFDDKIAALTGYSKADFDSRRLKWSDLIVAEDRDYAQKILIEALKSDRSYVREHRIRRKNGEILWVQCRGQIFLDTRGQIAYISGVFFDITEQKRAEDKLRQSEARLAETQRLAHLGSWEWLIPENKAIWSLETFHIYHQVPQPFGPSYEEFLSLIHPDDRDVVRKSLEEALGGGRHNMDFRILLADGTVRFLHGEAEVSFDEAGKPVRMLGMVQDITERRRAEEALKESEKNLRYLASQLLTAQERERQRISRELHDELGQSLLVMKLQMKLMEEKLQESPEAITAEWEHIRSRLDEVVDDVRRLSRDLSPHALEDLGLSAAIRHLVKEFCKYYHIAHYSVDLDEIDDYFAQEAQINIYRIFQESLTNIGKHARAHRVDVIARKQDDHVYFLVEDNGTGFNVAQVLAREEPERGMGLFAMEERVRMLEGSFNLWSQEGVGTRISFTLPLDMPWRFKHQGTAAS